MQKAKFSTLPSTQLTAVQQGSVAQSSESPRLRWLGIYLPWLSLEVLYRAGAHPTPLAIRDDTKKPRILICNEQAEVSGVCAGLSLSAAYALCPALRIEKRDEVAECGALEILAAWAGQFTSMVSLKPPQTLLLEVGASEQLFDGLKPLLSRIRAELCELGYMGRFAVTPTPLSASLLARAGVERIISVPARLTSRFADVPLTICGLDVKLTQALEDLGLKSLADCYRLPREGLARRFGTEMLLFLDRAVGRSPDPQMPYAFPLRYRNELQLPDPVETVEPLLFATHRLLLELVGLLRASDSGIQSFTVRLFHYRVPPTSVEVRLLAPSRQLPQFQMLLGERLERVVLPEEVDRIELEAPYFMAYVPASPDLFGAETQSNDDWRQLMEKLEARLGRHALRALSTVEEHRPEYQWSLRNPETKNASSTIQSATSNYRPLWLLPEPLLLRTHKGVPAYRGSLVPISYSERIESGWWDGRDVSRDYFRAVNTAGETFWIFKERRNREHWYLQGVFA